MNAPIILVSHYFDFQMRKRPFMYECPVYGTSIFRKVNCWGAVFRIAITKTKKLLYCCINQFHIQDACHWPRLEDFCVINVCSPCGSKPLLKIRGFWQMTSGCRLQVHPWHRRKEIIWMCKLATQYTAFCKKVIRAASLGIRRENTL